MSIKIDAYCLDKKYSLDELMKLFEKWRVEINDIAEKTFGEMCLKKAIKYYDLHSVLGPEYFERKLTESEYSDSSNVLESDYFRMKANKYRDYLFKKLANKDKKISVSDMLFDVVDIVQQECKENTYWNPLKSSIVVYPLNRKILFMYFGCHDYGQYIAGQPETSDYHYQNQTDRPDDISTSSWKTRERNWDKAIGPDYIPINHGFSVNFINADDVKYSIFNRYLRISDFSISLDERAAVVLEYCKDYPNPPESTLVSDWVKYTKSEEYLKWKENKFEEIKKIIEPNIFPISNKKEMIKYV